MSARFFDLLRKTLIQEYNNKTKIEKFIMGQEFYIDMVPDLSKGIVCRLIVTQLTYLRCTGHEDKIIKCIRSFIDLSNDDPDTHYFNDSQYQEFTGISRYKFCKDGGDNVSDVSGGDEVSDDVSFTTSNDSTDSYIAFQFVINSNCSAKRFGVFVEFVCDSLSRIYKLCMLDLDDRFALSCDTVFLLQRAGLPNDVIKIIESQL